MDLVTTSIFQVLDSGEKLKNLEKKSVRDLGAKAVELADARNKLDETSERVKDLLQVLNLKDQELVDMRQDLNQTKIQLARSNGFKMHVISALNYSRPTNSSGESVIAADTEIGVEELFKELQRVKKCDIRYKRLKARHNKLRGNQTKSVRTKSFIKPSQQTIRQIFWLKKEPKADDVNVAANSTGSTDQYGEIGKAQRLLGSSKNETFFL